MAVPLVTEVAAVAGRHRFVWVRSERGRQTVLLGDAAAARPVIDFDEDDGRALAQLGVTADERFVFFVRSAYGLERDEGSVSAARTTLYVVGAGEGAPRRVIAANISSVSTSPDSRLLVYSAGGEIWRVDLRDPELTPRRLIDVRGAQRDLVFSPDGQRIAFVSNRSIYGRGGFSFVAVYDLSSNRLTYMSPGLAYDQDPVWSPNGRRLAFIRSPMNPTGHRFSDYRTGPPFSLMVADTASGAARAVFEALRGAGSVFSPMTGIAEYDRLYARPNLFWSADGRLIFPWERTGWRLLYAVKVDEAAAPQVLTPGAFEVMSASLSSDRRRLLVTTNREEHIVPRASLLDLGSGRLTALGREGAGRALGWCGDGQCAILRQWTPARPYPAVMAAPLDGATPVVIDGATRAVAVSTSDVQVSTLRFKARDGLPLEAVVYRPLRPPAGRLPVLIYAHGGSRSQIYPGATYSPNEALPLEAVRRGYIYVALNYRSGEGYGLAFREPRAYGARSGGGGDVDDFVDLVAELRKDRQVDAARIGAFGASYGGYLVTNLLARHSDLFPAGASLYGVGDWAREMELDTGRPLPMALVDRLKVEDLAHRSSATSRFETWRSPLFLAQGDADTSGHMEANIAISTALAERGVPVEAHVFPEEQHGFSRWSSKVSVFTAMLDFFDRHLQPQGSMPANHRSGH